MKRAIGVALVWILAMAAGGAARAASTILKNDDTVINVKMARWVEADGVYSIVTTAGTSIQLGPNQIKEMDFDKPAKFGLAEEQFSNRQYDAALSSLDSVITEYRRMQWDVQARGMSAEILLKKNESKKAYAILEPLFAPGSKAGAVPAEVQLLYWKVMLVSPERIAQLRKALEEAIGTGNRDTVAAAYLVRGTMNRGSGQREAAVMDYLRVVVLFENVRAAHSEAMYMASEVLDELKDPRADELRRRLIEKYSDSDFAESARKKGA